MERTVVRLERILIENFKNVKRGSLDFANTRKPYRASILGLYGQNGSGKTALIDAMEILRLALSGQPIPELFADCINVDAECAKLQYELSVKEEGKKYQVFYSFQLRSEAVTAENNVVGNEAKGLRSRAVIANEVLSYAYEDNEGNKIKKSSLIDTVCSDPTEVFGPASKYNCLIGKDKNVKLDLLVGKRMAAGTSRSFVFSKELLEAVQKNVDNQEDNEYLRHVNLLDRLTWYANFELFVLNTANTGVISMNMLSMSVFYEKEGGKVVGNMLFPLKESVAMPEEDIVIFENMIANMNIVLRQIVPGLNICMKRLEKAVHPDGRIGSKIQLMSLKNGKAIPLEYESEGIKKIISILQLLIMVYNQSSITVAIDELDSGIFEYLLGELLRIISEKGKGQLIFTSHNLRPLETLDKGFIAFTTTNPLNRYIRMNNIKSSNNLRNFYFRDIVLGEQSEEVYESTNNAEIAMAFRKAGELK